MSLNTNLKQTKEKGTGMKKTHIKNIFGAAIAAFALVSGSVNAESLVYTGLVSNVFTMGDDYTFVTVGGGSGYYTGPNSAITTMIDNAKRHNQVVSVYIDGATSKITLVKSN